MAATPYATGDIVYINEPRNEMFKSPPFFFFILLPDRAVYRRWYYSSGDCRAHTHSTLLCSLFDEYGAATFRANFVCARLARDEETQCPPDAARQCQVARYRVISGRRDREACQRGAHQATPFSSGAREKSATCCCCRSPGRPSRRIARV